MKLTILYPVIVLPDGSPEDQQVVSKWEAKTLLTTPKMIIET